MDAGQTQENYITKRKQKFCFFFLVCGIICIGDKMRIGIACDHRGYKLKEFLKEHLNSEYEIIDLGTYSEDSVDYPDYAFLLGENVSSGELDFGIAICGSGIGISIACNKVKGIRCAKVSNVEEAKYTREDNDSNIIALGEKTSEKEALEIVKTFINTPFSNLEKHYRRINKISNYEENHNDR